MIGSKFCSKCTLCSFKAQQQAIVVVLGEIAGLLYEISNQAQNINCSNEYTVYTHSTL